MRILIHQPIPPQRRENAPRCVVSPICIHGKKSPKSTQATQMRTIFMPQEDFEKKNQRFSKILTGRK
jgi:hypothetical protein